jgi:hypothetical protein
MREESEGELPICSEMHFPSFSAVAENDQRIRTNQVSFEQFRQGILEEIISAGKSSRASFFLSIEGYAHQLRDTDNLDSSMRMILNDVLLEKKLFFVQIFDDQ